MNNSTEGQVPNICPGAARNSSCGAPPPLPPDVRSLLALGATLEPIFSAVEFSALSIAFISNLLIVLTVLTNRRMRSSAHLFLLNVAIADGVFSALNIVGQALELLLDPETLHLQKTYCIMYRPLIAVQFIAYSISMFCLAALSVERWYAICSPIKAGFSNRALKEKLKVIVLLVLWVAALAISVPMGLCKITVTKLYYIFLSVCLHVVPLLVIIVVNVKTVASLKRNAMFEVGPTHERRRENIQKLLITMILSVVVFWSPYHGLFLSFVFGEPPSSPSAAIKLKLAFRAGNVLTYFNPLLNGLLYYVFSKEFRRGCKTLFTRCGFGKKLNESQQSGQELSRFNTRKEAA